MSEGSAGAEAVLGSMGCSVDSSISTASGSTSWGSVCESRTDRVGWHSVVAFSRGELSLWVGPADAIAVGAGVGSSLPNGSSSTASEGRAESLSPDSAKLLPGAAPTPSSGVTGLGDGGVSSAEKSAAGVAPSYSLTTETGLCALPGVGSFTSVGAGADVAFSPVLSGGEALSLAGALPGGEGCREVAVDSIGGGVVAFAAVNAGGGVRSFVAVWTGGGVISSLSEKSVVIHFRVGSCSTRVSLPGSAPTLIALARSSSATGIGSWGVSSSRFINAASIREPICL